MNSEFIRRITSNPKTIKKLAPLLPQFAAAAENGVAKGSSTEGSQKEVEETLVSPQFQHALSGFCAAFPTGQLGPLVSQFGLGADAVTAAESGNMEAFLNAIQKEVDESPEEESVTSSTNEGVGGSNKFKISCILYQAEIYSFLVTGLKLFCSIKTLYLFFFRSRT